MPETPCLFENQTAVFLKCAEIDCVLESAKKPRTAGLCGRTAGACDCGPLSCSTIERVNKGRKPRNRAWSGGKNTLPKAHFPSSKPYPHGFFAHRPQTPQHSLQRALAGTHSTPALKRAHSGSHGRNTGRFPPRGTAWSCAASEIATERKAGRKWMHALRACVRFRRRREPAGTRSLDAVVSAALSVSALLWFVPTVSSLAPAVPVPLGTAVRSRGDSCRSAVDSIPPSSAAEHPAQLR